MLAVKATSCIGDTVYWLMMMSYLIAVGLWEQPTQWWESTITSATISINCYYILLCVHGATGMDVDAPEQHEH